MENVVFTQLSIPEVRQLFRQELETYFATHRYNHQQSEEDRWFDLDELVEYDPEKRSKPTFYGYVHRQEIPFHKNGKKLIFLKSEIDQWIKAGRKKTLSEIKSEADNYLQSKKKGGKR